jgi:hypothetical protein
MTFTDVILLILWLFTASYGQNSEIVVLMSDFTADGCKNDSFLLNLQFLQIKL